MVRDGLTALIASSAAFRSPFLTFFRHDAGCVRVMKGDIKHFIRCRHFQIERDIDFGAQPAYIVI